MDEYLYILFKKLIKKKKIIFIFFKEYLKLNDDIKMAVINESIKLIQKNYYDLRSKKVSNLIKNLNKNSFKKLTLGGCIFYKNGENLCLKEENI